MLCSSMFVTNEILHLLQDGDVPLHFAVWGGHIAFVMFFLSIAGIEINIQNKVSGSTFNAL